MFNIYMFAGVHQHQEQQNHAWWERDPSTAAGRTWQWRTEAPTGTGTIWNRKRIISDYTDFFVNDSSAIPGNYVPVLWLYHNILYRYRNIRYCHGTQGYRGRISDSDLLKRIDWRCSIIQIRFLLAGAPLCFSIALCVRSGPFFPDHGSGLCNCTCPDPDLQTLENADPDPEKSGSWS